ncbi:MAG TPA: methyltransferase domain-containing protein [Acidocella sp.]|nr:methyltransferase domain-containing protein [Acidocella sp.]HQU04463.1 methyltransferase domain-containing protein [Acidocella sp.]
MSDITEGTLLGGKLRYRQFVTGHRSGFEPVLLAASVPARSGELVLEAGTGAGAALLCLAQRVPGIGGVGVEIAAGLAALANENFKINGLDRLSCITADAAAPPFGQAFHHVMANPPWFDPHATPSPDAKRALAHHRMPGLLASWIGNLSKCLRAGGTMTLILPAASLSEAAACLRAAKCGGITLLPLWPRAGQVAKQVIISGKKAGHGADRLLPGLVLHDAAGITAAANAILRDGRALMG